MKLSTFCLVSIFYLGTFLNQAPAGDLILVKTSLYELKSNVSDSASQAELAKLAAEVRDNNNQLHFETSSVTRSGKVFTSKNTKSIRYPTQYSDTQLIRSKSDKRVYSIETTSETEHSNTIIIPGHATDFTTKELGTTVTLKPTSESNGKIRIEGSVTEVTLVDLAAANETPVITSQKKADSARKNEIATDAQKAPVFATAKTAFSNQIQGDGTPYYSIIKIKRSCLTNPIENEPEAGKGVLTRTVLNKKTDDNGEIVIYPAKPEEEIPVLIAISATPVKSFPKAVSGKGQKVHLTVRFIESETAPEESNSIFKDPQATVVMSDPQFQLMIRALNERKGIDLLSVPSVTNSSGQPAKIDVSREFIFPISYDAPNYDLENLTNDEGFPVTPATPVEFETAKLGVKMNLTATIQPNGNILINSRTRITEFGGFINYGNPIIETKINGLGKAVPITISENAILAPVFSTREQSNSVVIPNGSSCTICSLTDTKEVIYEDRYPLSPVTKVSRESYRREVFAIIKAQRMIEAQ